MKYLPVSYLTMRIGVALISLFCLFFFFPRFSPVSAQTPTPLYVREDGDDDGACDGLADAASSVSPASCAFQTIGKAVSTIDAGGTINIDAGTYGENVTLNKNVQLIGTGDPTTTSFTLTAGATLVAGTTGITAPTVNVDQTGGAGAKIGDALTLVDADGTINVAAGTYAENVTINKRVQIIGTGSPTTTSFTLTAGATLVTGTTGITAATVNVNQTGTTGAKVSDGINLVTDNGTVNVAVGTYAEDDLTISKPLTLVGTDAATTILKRATIGVGGILPSTLYINNVLADASNTVTVDGFTITTDPTATSTDYPINLASSFTTIKNSIIDSSGNPCFGIQGVSGNLDTIDITGNTFQYDASNACIQMIDFYTVGSGVSNLTLSSNTFATAGNSDFALRLGALDTAEITGNTFGSRVDFVLPDAADISNVTISNNTFEPTVPATSHQGGIFFESSGAAASTLSSITISNNDFVDNNTAVAFSDALDPARVDLSSITIHSNSFIGNSYGTTPYDKAVVVGFTPDSGTLNAESNWWNDASGPNAAGDGTSDYVDSDPFFRDAAMSQLSDNTYVNLALSSSSTGQVGLDAGQTAMSIYKDNFIDMTAGMSASLAGHITIAGADIDLSSVTSGDLTAVNLTTAQTIGDVSLTVDKGVRLDSGTVDSAMSLSTIGSASDVLVSIPDQTMLLSSSGWDGLLAPAVTYVIPSTDVAPSGYAFGDHVFSIGSPDVEMIFDKPITLTLLNTTAYYGFKPAGTNTWTAITDICAGTYESPTSPAFPGQCYIRGNYDTKIITYHFSVFSSLDLLSERSEGEGSSSEFSSDTCSFPKPMGVPDFFEVRARSKSVILLYTTVKENVTDYYVIYGFKPEDERYGFSFSAKPGQGEMWSLIIDKLQSGKPYYFKMRAGNGCAAGDWSGWLGGKTPWGSGVTYRYMKYK
jgi:hypothetical protein